MDTVRAMGGLHRVRFQSLGPARITVDDAPAPSELRWRKHVALLAYLARSPRRTRTREHLVGLLWGDREERSARHSLSEALRVFRRTLGDAGVRADVDQVGLAPGALTLDCDEFAAHAAGEAWGQAAALVQGEFLEGLSVPGANEFESWLGAERLAWRARGVDAITRHAEDLMAGGEVREAAREATRGLALAPGAEAAARVAMRALALAGDPMAALEVGERVVAEVRGQQGAVPGTETRDLLDRLRAGAAAGRRGLPGPPPNAAAPLPLVGRQEALRRLVGAWGRAQKGAGGVLFIEGEPGEGKTRLAQELMARARLDRAVIAAARAVPSDVHDRWSGVAGLMRGGIETAPGVVAAPPEAIEALRGGEDRGGWSPARALAAAVRAVSSEQPVLLVVDDAQYLDAGTADAMPQLARDLASSPVLIVLALEVGHPRPAWADILRSEIGRGLSGAVLRLDRLDREALTALARRALPRYEGAELDRLVRRLERDSAGVPLLAGAILEAVAAGLRLSPDASAWPAERRTLVDTLPGALPASVIGAVCLRFERLPLREQQVLAAASALGERVSPDTLERATARSRGDVEAALDRLEWDRWLAADARGYTFGAPIVRAVLLQEMVTPGQVRRFAAAAGG